MILRVESCLKFSNAKEFVKRCVLLIIIVGACEKVTSIYPKPETKV